MPDLSIEIDEDRLSASEMNITDKRDDDFLDFLLNEGSDTEFNDFNMPYSRHYVGYERNKENIDTLYWGRQNLTDYCIMAAWISEPNVNDKVQELDIEPAHTVTVDQRESEATVADEYISMSSPDINMELYTLNKSNGEMTVKMLPNISGAQLKFTLFTAQQPNKDEAPGPNFFTINVIQLPEE